MSSQRELRTGGAVSPDYPDIPGESLGERTDGGDVRIHQNVIAAIARISALKVAGVVDLSSGLVEGLAGMIGKRAMDRGIRVDLQENVVALELHVILEYGVRIPQVAWQLQSDVRLAVEQMTGKGVKSVQVIVEGVRVTETGKKIPGEIS